MNSSNNNDNGSAQNKSQKTVYEKKLDDYLKRDVKNPLENKPMSDQEKKDFIHRKLVSEHYQPPYV